MRYRTIVADPPWQYDGIAVPTGANRHAQFQVGGKLVEPAQIGSAPLPYPSMSLAEIAALPVDDLAERNARLFLWTTNRYLPAAIMLLAGWRFAYRQLLVWDKTPNIPPLGGSVARNACEFLIVAQRGTPGRTSVWASSIVNARKARSEHSRKPDAFLDIVEQVSPGPYLEMFARRARFGWDYWGDESLSTVEMPA